MLGYGATTNFAITLASLSAASSRESTAITAVVGGTAYDDYMLQLSLGSSQPTTAADKSIYIWFYGSADGTNFTEPCTGSDAAITIGTNHNLRGPYVVAVVVGTLQYDVCIGSVAQYFGGFLPKKWGIVIENQTNGALNGTEGNFNKWFTPVFVTT
jgi:hypothetical protein